MKTISFIATFAFSLSAFSHPADQGGKPVAEYCAAQIYAKIDKKLPAREYVSHMRMRPGTTDMVDLELTRNMGNWNLCVTSGEVKIRPDMFENGEGACEILEVKLSTDYDCG